MSIRDVASYCAKTLLKETTGPSPQYVRIFGPRLYSSLDVKDALEKTTGKESALVSIPPEKLAEYFANELPAAYVQDFVELITAQLPGGILPAEYDYSGNTVRGEVELLDGLRDIASTL